MTHITIKPKAHNHIIIMASSPNVNTRSIDEDILKRMPSSEDTFVGQRTLPFILRIIDFLGIRHS